MKKLALLIAVLLTTCFQVIAQSPYYAAWLRNTTNIVGRYYTNGNSTPITTTTQANVQSVRYSSNWVYVTTNGIPGYITGPYLDGNPSIATSQNAAIFRFPLNPTPNIGTPTATTGGNIGIFINGVALFDYRDGVSWKNSTSSLCGGPVQPPCTGDGVWNRDAIVAERSGFDCNKGHPAMGNYHHHQNPSAFKFDLNVISTVCNLYNADGLYTINSSQHSPLIGFAYDGYPIYGPYAYKNVDGTGGITRMKSSYSLRNITTRTTYYTGASVTAGPAVSTTYPLGYFREDYQYTAPTAATPDYLDDHNGRFCVTPEFPSGTYCYFATVDANHNSAYPYAVGPTYYGNVTGGKVTSIGETTTTYSGPILPLENIEFNGYQKGEDMVLVFTTINEKDISNYIIEVSTNGKDFTPLATIKPQYNGVNEYSYTDVHTVANIRFYRIKINNVNGSFSYSRTVLVSKNSTDKEVKVFPNPASNILIIQANGLLNKSIFVSLYSLDGKMVKQNTIVQGSTISYIDIANVADGNYVVVLNNGTTIKTFKAIIKH